MLFTNGGCGNINPPAQTPDYRVTQQFGRRLGGTVVYTAKTGLIPCPDPALTSILTTVKLPYATLTPDEVAREYQRAIAECVPELLFWQRARRAYDQWQEETLAALAAGRAPTEVEIDLQVVKIGPISFVAISGEVFSRMATDLRAAFGPRTYVVGYANGDIGYLPPAEVYAEGGYEVDMAYKFYGSNFMVAAGGFELLRDRALALLHASARDVNPSALAGLPGGLTKPFTLAVAAATNCPGCPGRAAIGPRPRGWAAGCPARPGSGRRRCRRR